ncbi:MAG: 30S ribosomal protein S17 [bacterium]
MDIQDKKNLKKRTTVGIVVGDGMNKTINVRVDVKKLHPKYRKFYRSSKRYHVHDEKGLAKIGDKVKFVECRPLSKTKRWRLLEVIK